MVSISYRPGVPGTIPAAWLIEPAAPDGAAPVVVVHGLLRNAEEMVELLSGRADATGRALVLPVFAMAEWPRYQRAACRHRADWALIALLRALREEGRIAGGRIDLAGFSGGAQFAHRFTWLYPDLVERLCLASPGWWTFPDPGSPYPFAMGTPGKGKGFEALWLRANLKRFLGREIVVRVGAEDIERDENLRTGRLIDARQGRNRLERAQRWCAAATQAASAQRSHLRLSFGVLEGCGHSFADCARTGGLDRDFVAPSAPCARCACQEVCTGRTAQDMPQKEVA